MSPFVSVLSPPSLHLVQRWGGEGLENFGTQIRRDLRSSFRNLGYILTLKCNLSQLRIIDLSLTTLLILLFNILV